jgi:hypothetical protein
MKKLKMYYFNPNTYGEEYFTIALNEDKALEYLKEYLYDMANLEEDDPDFCYVDIHKETYNEWKDITIDDLKMDLDSRPKPVPELYYHSFKYTIEEYEEGDVVRTELA